MGNSSKKSATLTFDEVQQFQRETCFSAHEILFLNHAYRDACNSDGFVDREAFTQIFSNFNKSYKALLFLDHIFRTWDVNKDGKLSFTEFIHAMSVTSRGTTQNRAEYLFRLYDINGDQEITIDEFLSVLKMKARKLTVDKMKKVFRDMDADGSGALTKEEFVNACARDATLLQALDIY